MQTSPEEEEMLKHMAALQPAAGQVLSNRRGEKGGNCTAVTHVSPVECVCLTGFGIS